MAIYIKSNGEASEILPSNGKKFDLREMQNLVGGSVQMVKLQEGILVADESGMYADDPVPNALVSNLFLKSYPHPSSLIPIFGDCLICSGTECGWGKRADLKLTLKNLGR